MKLGPLVIGFLTGLGMIAAILAGYQEFLTDAITAQWIAYGVYAIGVTAAIYLNKSEANKFGDFFSLGFKSFIITTLVLVIFTAIFNYLHPEIARESAELFKADLIKAQNRTPAEIEQDVKLYQDGFATAVISRSIFGYLVFGALATAISSLLLTLQKR
jgi:hypothetical protein